MEWLKIGFLFVSIMWGFDVLSKTMINSFSNKRIDIEALNIILFAIGITGFIYLQFLR